MFHFHYLETLRYPENKTCETTEQTRWVISLRMFPSTHKMVTNAYLVFVNIVFTPVLTTGPLSPQNFMKPAW